MTALSTARLRRSSRQLNQQFNSIAHAVDATCFCAPHDISLEEHAHEASLGIADAAQRALRMNDELASFV